MYLRGFSGRSLAGFKVIILIIALHLVRCSLSLSLSLSLFSLLPRVHFTVLTRTDTSFTTNAKYSHCQNHQHTPLKPNAQLLRLNSSIRGATKFLFTTCFLLIFTGISIALPQYSNPRSTNPPQINSNSVLIALLDLHYTELAELVEKALLLHTLEEAVGRYNITIFAPKNHALERDLDPEFKSFLLEPGNVNCPPGIGGPTRWSHSRRFTVWVPRSVLDEFNRRRSLSSITAVKPEGAPEVDPRTTRLKKPAPPVKPGSPPALPMFDAMAPVNLTSLATEMGRLVCEGYVLPILAPNDEAMSKLTTEQLSEAGAPEQIMYYHMVPEYQTEEIMYNRVRRFGKVKYDTLRVPHKVEAQEADGSVKFGAAYLFDPDIYTDGRISVQGD
ncbi:hypothetical protein Patl1_30259 [Pistacia atlantica]|uniref:Uncharacterized protein n=1 Tax=Pistacia atlantica TaxID=434234 RepID=A0ACC1A8Z5_9ROSI|nr:hypothetical protein Patl1_30259 [Pistacia atlantica]